MSFRFVFLAQCTLISVLLLAQSGVEWDQRTSLIDSLYGIGEYSEVVELIERQIAEAEVAGRQDSLYVFAYKLGRSAWKSESLDSGKQTLKDFNDHIVEVDPDPEHWFSAIGDLSWLLFETGDMRGAARVDSSAMNLLINRSDVSDHTKGKILGYLGFDNTSLGDHFSGMGFYQRALEHYKVLDDEHPEKSILLSETLNGIAACQWHMGRSKEAEANFLKALDHISEDESVSGLQRKASTYGNLALMWHDAGDFMLSREYFQRNLDLNRILIEDSEDPKIKDESVFARSRTYGNLAALYYDLGEYGTSRQYLDLALADREAILQPDDPRVHQFKQSYADLESIQKHHAKAYQLYSEFFDASYPTYGENSQWTAGALMKMAQEAFAMGDTVLGQAHVERSTDIYKTISDPESDPDLALCYSIRAEIGFASGKHEEALADARKAASIYELAFGVEHSRLHKVRLMLAESLIAQGKNEEALSELDAIIDNQNELEDDFAFELEESAAPSVFPKALYLRAKVNRSLGSDSDLVWSEMDKAMKLLKKRRLNLGDEESRLLYQATLDDIYDSAVEWMHEDYQNGRADQQFDRLTQYMDAGRTVLLNDRMSVLGQMRNEGVTANLILREKQLLDSIRPGLGADPSQAYDHYLSFLKEAEKEHPSFYDLRYQDEILSSERIRNELIREDQALVVYKLLDEIAFILVVTQESEHIQMTPRDVMDQAVEELDEAMEQGEREVFIENSIRLYDLLIRPISDYVSNKDLLIVPDDILHRLSFDVLIDKDKADHGVEKAMLIQEHAIAYLLSVEMGLKLGADQDRNEANRVLAVAPGFNETEGDSLRNSLVRQPFSLELAEQLTSRYGALAMMGTDATEASFKKQSSDHGVIHFGTHTQVNEHSPLYSKLILAHSNDSTDVEDGFLYAYEIYAMELQAELAVLTACETGVKSDEAGQGHRSLAHSFAYAGCPSVLMSLWAIDEQSSSDIVGIFYDEIHAGLPKDKALQSAKKKYLSSVSTKQQDPIYWAGLVFLGDTEPLVIGESKSSWWWMILLLMVAGGLLVLWRRSSSQKT